MKIYVSAVGNIRRYIPEEKEITLEYGVGIKELKEICGIPIFTNVVVVVNDVVVDSKYIVKDNDNIKFIMIVSAG